MRIALVALVLLGTATEALACPNLDLDIIATGGHVEGLVQTVPAHPSLYFHRGADENRPASTYIDEAGRPIPMVPVYTGIPVFPIRYDLAIERGTFFDSEDQHRRYVVDPEMVPRTQRIKTESWNGYFVIDITSDAALLRVDEPTRTYFIAGMEYRRLDFASTNVRITALYGDRHEEVIFGSFVAPAPPAAPAPSRVWLVLAVIAALTLVAACITRTRSGLAPRSL